MKRFFENLTYYLAWGAVWVYSLLPFRAVYMLSDGVAWLMRVVVRYRRRVVRTNLSNSFPEATEQQLLMVEKAYYRFLSDYFAETLKLASMSRRTMLRRMKVEGIEELNRSVAEGRSVSLFLGHYCNWEWVSSLSLHIDARARCGQIYHPLENPVADRLFLRLRSRFGAISVRKDDTFKAVNAWRKEGVPSVIGYIADQVPGYASIHYFADFLHQDTPVFSGAERISRILHADTYYLHLTRPRRVYYVCRFERMAADAAALPKFELTADFFRRLEAQINRHPQYWLWSHRRWKRTRARFLEIYGEEEAARRLTRL